MNHRVSDSKWRTRRAPGAAALALPLALAACSGGEPSLGEMDTGAADVELGTVQQAWAPGACGRAGANAEFDGSVDPAHVSPRSYNNCFKSYVVDIFDLSGDYTGPGAGGGQDAHLQVSWADTVPSNRADCEAISGGAIFYRRIDDAWVDQTGQLVSTGTFIETGPPLNLAFCVPPGVQFFDIEPGESYRVAATMRLDTPANPTRRVSVETVAPTIIR
jgi:hypothetical protein